MVDPHSYAQFTIERATDVYVVMGPFLDANNGVTPIDTLEIAASDVFLSKNNGAFAAKNDAFNPVSIGHGFYRVGLDVTDTTLMGEDLDNVLLISINMPGALPVWKEFRVTPELPV
jgi:hypothetical protein